MSMPSSPSGTIAAITRLRTHNAGNELLSNSLIRFVENQYPERELLRLERNPGYLMQYSTADLKADPIRTFEDWKHKLRQDFPLVQDPPNGKNASGYASLITPRRWPIVIRPVRRAIRLRQRIAGLSGFRSAFEKRLSTLSTRRVILYNPAGEITRNGMDVPLRTFLELSLARERGAKVVVVSHTVTTKDARFLQVASAVYNSFHAVFVRDTYSLELLRSAGLDQGCASLCPDLALLAEPSSESLVRAVRQNAGLQGGMVGIAINAGDARGHEKDWIELVRKLTQMGEQVYMLSNAYFGDKGLMRELRRATGAPGMDGPLGATEYSAVIANCKLVIASRLHTILLAAINGVPFVAVEPYMHKLRGVLQDMKYPIAAVDASDGALVSDVLAAVECAQADYGHLRRFCADEVPKLRYEVETRMRDVLDPLLGSRGSHGR